MTKEKPLKLIVFDCDGTLVNGLARITDSLHAGWKKAGLAKTDFNNIAQLVGLPLEDIIGKYLSPEQLHLVPSIAKDYRANYDGPRTADNEEPFFEGIRELLDWAHASPAILGIATGKVRKGLDGLLKHYQIPHYFMTLQKSGPGTRQNGSWNAAERHARRRV